MTVRHLFKVTGDARIISALKTLGPRVTLDVVKPAAKDAAKTIQQAIKPTTPYRTGALRKSVKVKTAKGPAVFRGRKVVAFAVIVGQTKPTANATTLRPRKTAGPLAVLTLTDLRIAPIL